jgi:hypothetical protein
MWIFKHKEKFDGTFERYKVRFVGDGVCQHVDIDCGETFSPVVKPATIEPFLVLLHLDLGSSVGYQERFST